MSVITTKITGGSTAPTRTGGTRFIVELATGQKPSTFDPALYDRAIRMHGQDVDVSLEFTPRGFVNLLDIGPPGSLGGSTSSQEPQMPQSFGTGAATSQNGSGGSTESYQRRQHPEVAEILGKQWALTTAVQALGADAADFDLVHDYAKKLLDAAQPTNENQVLRELQALGATDVGGGEPEPVHTGTQW